MRDFIHKVKMTLVGVTAVAVLATLAVIVFCGGSLDAVAKPFMKTLQFVMPPIPSVWQSSDPVQVSDAVPGGAAISLSDQNQLEVEGVAYVSTPSGFVLEVGSSAMVEMTSESAPPPISRSVAQLSIPENGALVAQLAVADNQYAADGGGSPGGAGGGGETILPPPVILPPPEPPPVVKPMVEPLGGTETGNPAPVPEPATLLLFGTGILGVAGMRKRFKK